MRTFDILARLFVALGIVMSPGLFAQDDGDGLQVHHATAASAELNASPQMTANLTEDNDQGHWIKATVNADGASYTITNGRNGYSRTYTTK